MKWSVCRIAFVIDSDGSITLILVKFSEVKTPLIDWFMLPTGGMARESQLAKLQGLEK